MTIVIPALPQGMSWTKNTEVPSEPPRIEAVCGECLTAKEITRLLSPVVEYVLWAVLSEMDYRTYPEMCLSLERVRVLFMMRNFGQETRPAALAALGLGE